MSNERALIAIMTALESAHAFSAYLPSYFTIRTLAMDGTDTENKLRNLRLGYIPAVLMSLAIGWIASEIIKSWWPMLGVVVMSGIMIAFYEAAVRI